MSNKKTNKKPKSAKQARQSGTWKESPKDNIHSNKIVHYFESAAIYLQNGSIPNHEKHNVRQALDIARKQAKKVATHFMQPKSHRDTARGKNLLKVYNIVYDNLGAELKRA